MEQEVLQLLQGTTASQEATRKSAELSLLSLYANADFPFALLAISKHLEAAVFLRQAALLSLNRYILATWSPKFDEDFKGTVVLNEEAKSRIRDQVLAICTGDGNTAGDDRKVKNAASLVASKIASVDFPEQWPELLPTLLQIISGTGPDSQVHGALRVLSELVESGFSEEQFFAVARDLVNGLQNVALNVNRKPIVRAMAMSVFRGCFDTLEMVMEDHKAAVKGFLDEALKGWMAFFIETIALVLPEPPSEEEETKTEGLPSQWRGMIALKLQVVKTLEKIRAVFYQILTPQATLLFQTTWEDLSKSQLAYHQMFINDERQGRLEDADSLPYTLDFLVLEELDFMTIMLKAPPVKSELESQLKQASNGPHSANWLQEMMKLVVSFAQITTEEEGLWDIDVNLFLSEETSVTANYTPRAACGDLVIRGLGEWLKQVPIDALLTYCQASFTLPTSTWKAKEATLFILNQLLRDLEETSNIVNPSIVEGFQPYIAQALQDSNVFLRARAYLVLGTTARVAGESYQQTALTHLNGAIQAMTGDPSELVQVSCIRVLQDFLQGLPSAVTKGAQGPVIAAISNFMASHDLRELSDSDDLKVTLVETLRDAIMIDTSVILDGPAIDLLFTLASDGASNFQISTLVTESFEAMVQSITALGHEPYVRLCAKTIPSLTGAFDVANMTSESSLTNLAAELVSALAEYGSEPLPDGFVAAVMPKLNRVLLEATDAELVRPATLAVQHTLAHGPIQFLAWSDSSTGQSAIEVTLTIINRLLNSPDVDDNAAAEVGGLASELVNKAGSEKLGPYLLQLLQAVAARLASAEKAHFIQSLIMVFAGLSVSAPKEVVDFLSQININNENGLNVVLSKWLENSINFAGYSEIRQNVMALSKLYELQDPRVKQIGVKGDLIVQPSNGRIKTRSQARLNPDKWTIIPADLKIVKILVEELSSANTNRFIDPSSAAAAALDSEGSDDGDEWEDVGTSGTLDLGLGLTKQQIMGFDEEANDGANSRARDDETAEYLAAWFSSEAQNPVFHEMYNALTEGEKEKLQTIGG